MRVSFTTEQKSTTADVDAIWLDRYGNLYEWAGDDWYLLATRQEADWRMPGGFTTDLMLIEGTLGLSAASPFEHPDVLFSGELESLSLCHRSGFVRLCSRQDSLATLIPAAPTKRGDQEWLVEGGTERDLFLAPLDAFARPWLAVGLGRRARPSALAERLVVGEVSQIRRTQPREAHRRRHGEGLDAVGRDPEPPSIDSDDEDLELAAVGPLHDFPAADRPTHAFGEGFDTAVF